MKEQGDKHVDAVNVCLANGKLLYNDLQNLHHVRHEMTPTLSIDVTFETIQQLLNDLQKFWTDGDEDSILKQLSQLNEFETEDFSYSALHGFAGQFVGTDKWLFRHFYSTEVSPDSSDQMEIYDDEHGRFLLNKIHIPMYSIFRMFWIESRKNVTIFFVFFRQDERIMVKFCLYKTRSITLG